MRASAFPSSRLTGSALALLTALAGVACTGSLTGSDRPAAAVVVTVAPGSTLAPPPPAKPSAAGVDPTTFDWRNTTYPADACGSLVENNTGPVGGFVTRDGRANTDLSRSVYRIVHVDTVALGDLTGDGRRDAVIGLQCDAGGNYVWETVWLYTEGPAAPRRLASATPGPADLGELRDHTLRFLDGRAVDGRFESQWYAYSPTDAHCCPSRKAAFTMTWTGSAWRTRISGITDTPIEG
jgi:hypothetical protein